MSRNGKIVTPHQLRVDLYLADVTGEIERRRALPEHMTWQGIDVSRTTDAGLYADLESMLRIAWAAARGT